MTPAVLYKLLAIALIVALGWVVGKARWLGDEKAEPARVLSNAAFYLFCPALFFRTTARIDLAHLPLAMLAAFFVPVLAVMALVYSEQRFMRRRRGLSAAAPAVRAITVGFGNSVQIGIPVAAGLFGEAGLALHLTIVAVHALVLLLLCTTLVELDLAQDQAGADPHLGRVLQGTLRNTLIHPVVLPVLAGMAWRLSGWPLPGPVDDVLQVLGAAVVPLCLTLIGMSLAYLGLPKRWHAALGLSCVKLLLAPALVLWVAHVGFGLQGLPLSVVVMLAALPVGSNALMFAQRYRALEAETTAAMVFSTLGFVVTAPLWVVVLQGLKHGP
jgi:predicted permease